MKCYPNYIKLRYICFILSRLTKPNNITVSHYLVDSYLLPYYSLRSSIKRINVILNVSTIKDI